DAHCAQGHLDPDRELGGGLRLDTNAAADAIGALPEAAGGASGILAVVRATMARALRKVSTERGVDPAGLVLVAYGGAGPLHATALARELGCRAVVVPPAPGVLSALGLLLAPARYEASRTVMASAEDDLTDAWQALETQAREELERQGVASEITLSRVADARYAGQSHELRIAADPGADLAQLLHSAHQEAYGYAIADEPVRIVTLRVVARGEPILSQPPGGWDQGESAPESSREIDIAGHTVTARVVSRAGLAAGDEVSGPALIEQSDTTTLLASDEVAVVDDAGNLVVHLHG
ncbi:MAG: hydantoinase/oxoprolinase family protein, partial [Actinomycetota bacterium]|nr:hydantoinase/oxoprolinase family protein [Actinomycetota bacterium]